MLKTRLQLPRNQGVSLNPRQRRHFDECKSVVSDIEMRVVVPTGIDGSRSQGSMCSGSLANMGRREVQKRVSEVSLDNVRSVSEVNLVRKR